ncbi:MAG: ABC transporter permease [Acidimicrobiales bacterium]|nr:ABC transporter permease [Actinomycetes bacterium]MDP6288283.1 ABC transporter permease [Acidimicrobiales bacterium]MDP6912209.1 ABC transporter permease [Acidimicrobiales bacterium]HCW01066.1 ABC transporter permease [Acidimicrobiaceae bacterium]HJM72878.1 ABC transporter permease [Acidimicrobiales bacterium]
MSKLGLPPVPVQTRVPSTLRRGPRNAEQMFPGSSRKSRFGNLFGKMPWLTKICFLWLILVVLAAALADLIPGLADPNYQGFVFGDGKTNEGPTASHWLGTDNVSRDILARLIYGARVSLIFAFSLVAVGIVVGGTLGSIAGYFRGLLETFLMALVDTWLSFPALIGLVFITTMLGMRNLVVLVLVGAVFVWPSYTRIARATALSVSGQAFVTAARAIGTSRKRILVREIFPNVLPALLAYSLVGLPVLIILESTLSFLGLGVEIPTASWGGMINQARQDLLINIWPAVWPAATLFMTVYSFNNLADWVRAQAAARSAAI